MGDAGSWADTLGTRIRCGWTVARDIKPKLGKIQWMNHRALPNTAYVPTTVEHIANICTHAACVAPACIAACVLLSRSLSPHQTLAAAVYGAALCLLFLVSTCFHSCCYTGFDCKSWKRLFDRFDSSDMRHFLHRCDRAMIYVFIAGSYFPWLTVLPISCHTLLKLRWIVWLLAVLGITYQQVYHEKYKMLELMFYLVMALGPAIFIVLSNHEFPAMYELKLGGLLYLTGVFFFKSDGCIPFAHAIWHVFVAGAATIHYLAILHNLFPSVDK